MRELALHAHSSRQADHPLSLPFFLSFHPLDTPLYPIPHAVLPTLDRKTLHQLGCEAAPSSSSANWLHHSITTARIGRHVLTQPQQQHGNGDCTTIQQLLFNSINEKWTRKHGWIDCCCVMARQCHKTWWNYLCRYLSAEQGETTA